MGASKKLHSNFAFNTPEYFECDTDSWALTQKESHQEEESRWPYRGLPRFQHFTKYGLCGAWDTFCYEVLVDATGDAPPSTHGRRGTLKGITKTSSQEIGKTILQSSGFLSESLCRRYQLMLIMVYFWNRSWLQWHSAGCGMSAIWDGKPPYQSFITPVLKCLKGISSGFIVMLLCALILL